MEIGIRAVIYLQQHAGIVETPESARLKWEALDSHKQQQVVNLYEDILFLEREASDDIIN